MNASDSMILGPLFSITVKKTLNMLVCLYEYPFDSYLVILVPKVCTDRSLVMELYPRKEIGLSE